MKLAQRLRKRETGGESSDQLERSPSHDAPQPQPERAEPTKSDPGLSDLSKPDYLAIIQRAGRETLDDNVPMIASALAYSSFLAIPSALLVATGLFTLVAGPDTISNLMQHLGQIAPKETVTLLNDSLQRLNCRKLPFSRPRHYHLRHVEFDHRQAVIE